MGRQWLKFIAGIGDYRQDFIDAYPVRAPDPANPADAALCADPHVWELLAAVAGRAMDGQALLDHLDADPAHHAYDGVAGIGSADHGPIDNAVAAFRAWYARVLRSPPAGRTPGTPRSWTTDSASRRRRRTGRRRSIPPANTFSGRLDWYSLRRRRRGARARRPVRGHPRARTRAR